MTEGGSDTTTSPLSTQSDAAGPDAPAVTRVVSNPLLQQHLGLVLSGFLTLLLAVNIMVTSNYNSQTALAIVQVAGTSKVLVSTLVSVLPYLVVMGFFVSFGRWHGRLFSLTGNEATALFSAAAPLVSLLLFVTPLVMVSMVVAFLAITFVIAQRRKDPRPEWLRRWIRWRNSTRHWAEQVPEQAPEQAGIRRSMTPFESAASQASVLTMSVFMAAISPWMPSEAVALGQGEPVKAQVVGERGDETVYLPDGTIFGLRVARTDDLHREYCEDRSWASVTAFQLFRDPAYDKCPD